MWKNVIPRLQPTAQLHPELPAAIRRKLCRLWLLHENRNSLSLQHTHAKVPSRNSHLFLRPEWYPPSDVTSSFSLFLRRRWTKHPTAKGLVFVCVCITWRGKKRQTWKSYHSFNARALIGNVLLPSSSYSESLPNLHHCSLCFFFSLKCLSYFIKKKRKMDKVV